MTEWRTRRASLYDEAALADLCRAAVGPDDYVVEFLEDLLLRGVTYVALDGDRIVGMMTYQEVFDGSAWLGQARTHPAYRRRGVASALVEVLEGLAGRKGVRAARLLTEAANRAGVASFTRAGFREVARFARFSAKASVESPRFPLAQLRFTEDLWAALERSPFVRQGKGYVSYGYVFVRFDRATAHYLASLGALWEWDGHVVLLDEVREAFSEDLLNATPLLGPPEEILRDLPRISRARGASRVETFLPLDRRFVAHAHEAGFEPATWGQEAILAEKPLVAAKAPARTRKTYAELYASRSRFTGPTSAAHGHGASDVHEDRWNA